MKRLIALMTAVVMLFALVSVAYAGEDLEPNKQTTSSPSGSSSSHHSGGSGGSSGGGGGGGGGSSTTTPTTPTTTTQTTTAADGSTITETTTTNPDGTTQSTTEVNVSTSSTSDTTSLPVTTTAAASTGSAKTLKVKMPASASGTVQSIEIPVTNANENTVVYLVDKNGNETLVTETVLTDKGVAIPYTGDQELTIKVVNNAKTFVDSDQVASWFKDEIDFLTAREIIIGNDKNELLPKEDMTYGRMATIISRVAEAGLKDTGAAWSDAPVAWADSKGMNPDGLKAEDKAPIQQAALMFYILMDKPETTGDLSKFADGATVGENYVKALTWCVEKGIIEGDGTNLNATSTASFEQLCAVVARFIQKR